MSEDSSTSFWIELDCYQYADVPMSADKAFGVTAYSLRNRYYNPATRRFTQEDPIGLAGGLNLYGFANGDPVNYSAPFGLCGEKNGNPCPSKLLGALLQLGKAAAAPCLASWRRPM